MQIGNTPLCEHEDFKDKLNTLSRTNVQRLFRKTSRKRIEKDEIKIRLQQVYDSRYKDVYYKILNGQITNEKVFEYYLSFFKQTRIEFIDKDLILEEDIKHLFEKKDEIENFIRLNSVDTF